MLFLCGCGVREEFGDVFVGAHGVRRRCDGWFDGFGFLRIILGELYCVFDVVFKLNK